MTVMLVVLVVEALFEAWLEVRLGTRGLDSAGREVLLQPSAWPGLIRNGLLIALAVLTLLLAAVRGTLRQFATTTDAALLVLVFVLVTAGVVGGSSAMLIGEAVYVYLRGVIVFYAVRALDPPWALAKGVIWLVGAVILANALLSIIQLVGGTPAFTAIGWTDLSWASLGRSHGLQNHPNHLGHIVGLMVLGVVAWFVTSGRIRARWWIVPAVLALSLAATQSRESLAGVVFGIAMIGLIWRLRLKMVGGVLGLVLLAVAIVWIGQPSNLAELSRRLQGVVTAVQIPSGSEDEVICQPGQDCTSAGVPRREIRVLYLQQGFTLWTRSPWLGYGVGQFGGAVASQNDPRWYANPKFGPEGFDMHGMDLQQVDSFWLHLVVETGLIGTAAYLTWYALLALPCGRFALRARRRRGAPRALQVDADDAPSDASTVAPSTATGLALWAVAALAFGALVAGLSPSLEDPQFPPLLLGIVGLGWVMIRHVPARTGSQPVEEES
jgi:O-antigen ligase